MLKSMTACLLASASAVSFTASVFNRTHIWEANDNTLAGVYATVQIPEEHFKAFKLGGGCTVEIATEGIQVVSFVNAHVGTQTSANTWTFYDMSAEEGIVGDYEGVRAGATATGQYNILVESESTPKISDFSASCDTELIDDVTPAFSMFPFATGGIELVEQTYGSFTFLSDSSQWPDSVVVSFPSGAGPADFFLTDDNTGASITQQDDENYVISGLTDYKVEDVFFGLDYTKNNVTVYAWEITITPLAL